MNCMRCMAVIAAMLLSVEQIYTQTTVGNMDLQREVRGLWVASVDNIDWPSAPGLSEDALKREALTILDRAQGMGLNVIYLQVRPSSDALYHSTIEPLSYYLVGDKNGDALGDFDPLNFWTEQAHQRGMELHAWLNPFRVLQRTTSVTAADHISKKHPEWTFVYGDKVCLNPGIPEAREYVRTVVQDIVTRYDVDGIHLDDYFYPYPVKGAQIEDSEQYATYNDQGLSLSDWRRDNVTQLIQSLSSTIHDAKPWARFGISPFGVWRNKSLDDKGSDTRAGLTDYDDLYADILRWANDSIIDYVIPQIYWESGNKAANFDVLTQWWGQYCGNIHVYVGHAVFKVNAYGDVWKNADEIPTQIEKVRQDQKLGGSVFFSYRQFNRDILGLERRLKEQLYTSRALPPAIKVTEPSLNVSKLDVTRSKMLTWRCDAPDSARFYVIRAYPKGQPMLKQVLQVVSGTSWQMPEGSGSRRKWIIQVSAVDKYGNEGQPSKRLVVRM